jgi:hypothetical protein
MRAGVEVDRQARPGGGPLRNLFSIWALLPAVVRHLWPCDAVDPTPASLLRLPPHRFETFTAAAMGCAVLSPPVTDFIDGRRHAGYTDRLIPCCYLQASRIAATES